ncbi:tripartite tricarboxylate transporter substrate-binding protein [Paracoccus sp. Z330]|uniref:Tripartite tricarboxylate transporter substrate-binding protein n=1 Tax=Paracoccus onchidii TaxID=3017813 RepID=A0ABT4ZBX4_9RHOB|nr:tripartite tricarboxylate transporter substrate-binding protein [Paracoccus onchidii]MDB6176221.1 tripartite tricarboxylate transporter substrate-binding protein [Paracoccus onchidii]
MKSFLLAASVVAVCAGAANAEWTPDGPVKMMIGFKAGGGADTLARMLAEDIQSQQGWNLLPVNVDGRGGAIMARELKDSPSDGMTIGVGITDTFAYGHQAMRDPGYAPEDFDFLATLAGTQMGIVAKSDRGWKDLGDVLEAAKAGEEISFGTMTPRLADGAYYIGKVNEVDFSIVSNFSGGQDVLNAINAGDIDIGWVAGPQKAGVVSGDLINLANGEHETLEMSPDTRGLSDFGVDFGFGTTFLVFAPAGLSDEAKAAWSEAIIAAVDNPDSKVRSFIDRLFVAKTLNADEASAYVATEADEALQLLDATAE